MNIIKCGSCVVRKLAWIVLATTLAGSSARAKTEETFPLLHTKTATYTNVTVTTKDKSYVFILHSAGMNSVKVSDLPTEIQEQLGYAVAVDPSLTNKSKSFFNTDGTNRMAVLAKGLSDINDKIKPYQSAWQERMQQSDVQIPEPVMYAGLVVVFMLYIFFCYCCHLICAKSTAGSSILVWVPIFQFIPLLRAAGMSGWWFLFSFIPITQILWAMNIAKTRGKSLWVTFFLLLPFTTFFAMMYLAFSKGTPKAVTPRYKSMSLATA